MTNTRCLSRFGGAQCVLYFEHGEEMLHHDGRAGNSTRWRTKGQDRPTTIHVTEEHVAAGEPWGPNCPVWNAIRATLPEGYYVAVCGFTVRIGKRFDAPSKTYRMPTNAVEAITRYDVHQVMEPFDFELDLNEAIQ